MPLLDLGSVTGIVEKSFNTAANSSVSSWATYAASTGSASLLGEGYAKVGAFRAGHDLTRLVCSLVTELGSVAMTVSPVLTYGIDVHHASSVRHDSSHRLARRETI